MDFDLRIVQWTKEAKPLNMVEVEMGEKNIDLLVFTADGFSHPPDPCPRI
jgi:hypothetical protein